MLWWHICAGLVIGICMNKKYCDNDNRVFVVGIYINETDSNRKQLIDYVLIQLSLGQDWWWWLKIETQLGDRYFDFSNKYQTE